MDPENEILCNVCPFCDEPIYGLEEDYASHLIFCQDAFTNEEDQSKPIKKNPPKKKKQKPKQFQKKERASPAMMAAPTDLRKARKSQSLAKQDLRERERGWNKPLPNKNKSINNPSFKNQFLVNEQSTQDDFQIALLMSEQQFNEKKQPQGVTQSRLKMMPITKYEGQKNEEGEETPCPICYMSLQRNDDYLKLACGHGFHPDCVSDWLKMKSICPICKQDSFKTK